MSISIYKPYFYIIQHIQTSKYYAGVKYGKNANPENLLRPDGYQTSSNIIKQIILEEGLVSFVIRKIKIFETGVEALDYESRFLRKVNAAFNIAFLNRCNNSLISPFGQEFTDNLSYEQKNKVREGGIRGLVIARKKAQEMYPHSAFYGKRHTDETKKKIGLASKERVGEKNGVFGKMWITNGIESKMVLPNTELPFGWRKGSPLHGIMLINNGIENKRIKKGDIIPEGWNKGRLIIKK